MMRPSARRRFALTPAIALAALIAASVPLLTSVPSHAAKSDVDIRRSLVATEQPILARFPFQRVLDQLVAQSAVPGLTSLELFQQWWDTQNPGPGLGLGAHCDDVNDAGGPTLNSYPYTCRPAPSEGGEAASQPFTDPDTNPTAYVPIGLFNRFDLAPADGSHCGEHRIVYARRSGITANLNRNLIIFEAILPNPKPKQGLKGCASIVKFWADLTNESDVTRRADALEDFYFNGLTQVGPVVHVNNFGNNALGAGQVRTNQFMMTVGTPKIWSLREFKLLRTCAGSTCTLAMVPVTTKGNPYGPLFSPTGTHPGTADFQEHMRGQVAGLAASSVTDFAFEVPDTFNTGQSQAAGENNYVDHFGTAPSQLQQDIEAALPAGSGLTAANIVARAQTQSCAGCHRLSQNPNPSGIGAPLPPAPLGGGLVWPASLGFTHVTEQQTETVDGVTRYLISPALVDVFLPKRKQILDDYLNDKPIKVKKPKDPIGGRRTH
jgi:hypothetical protein